VFTCRLSVAGQREAEQSRCAGNTTLPGTVHHIRLVVSSADCDQLLSCTASLNRQTVFMHVSTSKIIQNIIAIVSQLLTTLPLLLIFKIIMIRLLQLILPFTVINQITDYKSISNVH